MSTKNENAIEEAIQAKNLNAPRLTPDYIDSLERSVQYYVFPNTTVTVCCITLANGASVVGESACASSTNFDEKIGKQRSYERARSKIWELEGYLLCQKLSQQEVKSVESQYDEYAKETVQSVDIDYCDSTNTGNIDLSKFNLDSLLYQEYNDELQHKIEAVVGGTTIEAKVTPSKLITEFGKPILITICWTLLVDNIPINIKIVVANVKYVHPSITKVTIEGSCGAKLKELLNERLVKKSLLMLTHKTVDQIVESYCFDNDITLETVDKNCDIEGKNIVLVCSYVIGGHIVAIAIHCKQLNV